MQFDQLNHRELILALGGTAARRPLAAPAQQPGRIRRIGVLMGIAESDPTRQSFVSAFTQSSWVGVTETTSASIIAGVPATTTESAASRESWSSCSRI